MKVIDDKNWYPCNIEVSKVEFPDEDVVLYLRNSSDSILDAKKCYASEALDVTYAIYFRIADKNNYSTIDLYKITNCIKAYVMINGSELLSTKQTSQSSLSSGPI